jgi:phage tail-like protein
MAELSERRVMHGTGGRVDQFPVYLFRVLLDEGTVATFAECGGLEVSVKFDEIREGGQNEFVHKLPGRVEVGNLVLRRGYAPSNEFFKWVASVMNRTSIKRRKVTVQLVDMEYRAKVVDWTFLGAYPVRWSGPTFRAGESVIAIESLELAHQGLLLP